MLQERKQSIIFAILILAAAGLPNASAAASENLSKIATKNSQITSLWAALDEHVANLTSSLKELRSEIAKKDEQIANLTLGMEGFRRNTTKDIQELKAEIRNWNDQISNLSASVEKEISIREDQIATLTTNMSEFQRNQNFFQGPVRISQSWGEDILMLWSSSLPTKSVSPCVRSTCRQEGDFYWGGYVSGYLHVRTNLMCGVSDHAMYHFVFRGHLFVQAFSFHCEAVGYVTKPDYFSNYPEGHADHTAWCRPDTRADGETGRLSSRSNLEIFGYCAPESQDLVFRFEEPHHRSSYWHASGLTVDFHGYNGYHQKAAKYVTIKEATHSPADKIW